MVARGSVALFPPVACAGVAVTWKCIGSGQVEEWFLLISIYLSLSWSDS